MSIGAKTLKQHSSKYIVLTQDQTIGDVVDKIKQEGYKLNQTYLVVKGKDDTYKVMLLSGLGEALSLIGIEVSDTPIVEILGIPLYHLQIPEAQRVVSVATSESSDDVLEWVSLHPQSTLVVVDGQNCVGVFSNPNLSGILEDWSCSTLYGRMVDISTDDRRYTKPAPPRCPICDCQNFFKFDPKKNAYVCPACGAEIKQR